MATDVTTLAEDNLITKSDLARVREADFIAQFNHNVLGKLTEVLGVTRKIPVMEGTTLYTYTTSGTLESGDVSEGDVIPLSKYAQEKQPIGSVSLLKWRKAVSAEAILKSGANAAIAETDAAMLKDVQKTIRSGFFAIISDIQGVSAEGATLQAALADAWGKLQVAFEDDAAEAVYFLNPADMAAYLGTAQITMQTAFGMNYITDFLGLGTVILSNLIQAGTFIATAKNNIIMYYLPMNGDVAREFNLASDESGFIGINSGYTNEERATKESLIMSGITFFPEYAGGVVNGTITSDEDDQT